MIFPSFSDKIFETPLIVSLDGMEAKADTSLKLLISCAKTV